MGPNAAEVPKHAWDMPSARLRLRSLVTSRYIQNSTSKCFLHAQEDSVYLRQRCPACDSTYDAAEPWLRGCVGCKSQRNAERAKVGRLRFSDPGCFGGWRCQTRNGERGAQAVRSGADPRIVSDQR